MALCRQICRLALGIHAPVFVLQRRGKNGAVQAEAWAARHLWIHKVHAHQSCKHALRGLEIIEHVNTEWLSNSSNAAGNTAIPIAPPPPVPPLWCRKCHGKFLEQAISCNRNWHEEATCSPALRCKEYLFFTFSFLFLLLLFSFFFFLFSFFFFLFSFSFFFSFSFSFFLFYFFSFFLFFDSVPRLPTHNTTCVTMHHSYCNHPRKSIC